MQAGCSRARFPNRNGVVKIVDHFADGGYHIGRVALGKRTMRVVLVFPFCEIGKNAAAWGPSLSVKCLPSAMMPTIWIEAPEPFLK
jgi:hypothetical protein